MNRHYLGAAEEEKENRACRKGQDFLIHHCNEQPRFGNYSKIFHMKF